MVKTKGSHGGSASGGGGGARPGDTQPSPIECCMCGDHGITIELFKCKICKFRSQHKYCSNLYPKLETYNTCNWCLHDSAGKSRKSGETRGDHAGKSKGNPDEKMASHKDLRERTQRIRKANLEIKVTKSFNEMKKVVHGSSAEESPVSTSRKRIVVGGGVVVEDKKKKKNNVVLRKSKSENHLGDGGGIKIRPVFKHRVRRYKLLDEISSQCS
uniref:uncharacterized protein LOC122608396 n=1 Tax=Erigeron canadensis TaxID=72917 RepID=UPI001CB9612C|nr:uncharacterized protein LOC122608396 [Erigeron canadensis]